MKTPPAGRACHHCSQWSLWGAYRRLSQICAARDDPSGNDPEFENGCLTIAGDLAHNIAEGDANHLGLLAEAGAMLRPTVLIYLRRRRRKSLHQTQTA